MVEQVAPDDMLTGELLMVDGQVLLSKGFEQQGADIEPLIQAPSLMLQLAYELLNRVSPKALLWSKRSRTGMRPKRKMISTWIQVWQPVRLQRPGSVRVPAGRLNRAIFDLSCSSVSPVRLPDSRKKAAQSRFPVTSISAAGVSLSETDRS